MKRVGIVGYGYVGKAMFNFFRKHYDMVVLDPYGDFGPVDQTIDEPDIQFTTNDYEAINNCDLVLVCVPTPRSDIDGSCDTSLVESVIKEITSDVLIVIKSTVDIGTTERLKKEYDKRIIFSPEFCGESKYWTEFKWHTDVKESPWFIFGGDSRDTEEAVGFYMKVGGPTKQYIQTDTKTAELTKYVENCFYATKVTFCYEVAEICKLFDVDYNKMRELWLLDPRISRMHTSVFPENDKPFAGKCFPKDLSALVSAAKRNGYDANLLDEVLKSNGRIGQRRSSNKE